MSKHGTITIQRRFNADSKEEYADIRCPHCNLPHNTIKKMNLDCMERSQKQFDFLQSLLKKELGWDGMVKFTNWESENTLTKEEASNLIGSLNETAGLVFEEVLQDIKYELE